MTGFTARRDLVAALQRELPDSWRVIPGVRSLDRIDRPTAQLKPSELTPNEAAPMAAFTHQLTLTGISPHADVDRALDDLDDRIGPDMIDALDRIDFARFDRAQLVAYDDAHLALDLTVTIHETRM